MVGIMTAKDDKQNVAEYWNRNGKPAQQKRIVKRIKRVWTDS